MTGVPNSHKQPGEMIAGKYRVERVLGVGGMGIVVEAMHMTLDEKVAIKGLLPEALANEAAVARFAREARAAAKIKSEHVCRVLDVVEDSGIPYLVMEYLEGRDLDDMVTKGGPLPPEQAVDFMLQACEALAEAHVAGIVHRDLKPANLFVAQRADGSPIIKVLDFGISKVTPKEGAIDAAMTKTSSLLGSPLYMSPEQMKTTRSVDARTDIWSLGIIFYEILTGRPPFEGETIPSVCAAILSETPAPLPAHVPRALADIVLRCLEKTPDLRFQNVAQLAQALRPFAPSHSSISIDRITRVVGASPRFSSPDMSAPPVPPSARAVTGPQSSPDLGAVDSTVLAGPVLRAPAPSTHGRTQGTFEIEGQPRKRRTLALVGGGATFLGVAALVAVLAHGRGGAGSSAASASVVHEAPIATNVAPPPAETAAAAPASAAVVSPPPVEAKKPDAPSPGIVTPPPVTNAASKTPTKRPSSKPTPPAAGGAKPAAPASNSFGGRD